MMKAYEEMQNQQQNSFRQNSSFVVKEQARIINNKFEAQQLANVSVTSDTDSSLSQVKCCQMPFKLKW